LKKITSGRFCSFSFIAAEAFWPQSAPDQSLSKECDFFLKWKLLLIKRLQFEIANILFIEDYVFNVAQKKDMTLTL
jgi:hypothetical protein